MEPGQALRGRSRPQGDEHAELREEAREAAGEVKVSGCEAPDARRPPVLPCPLLPSSPSPSDVLELAARPVPHSRPSPPPRGRYSGSECSRPATRHSLQEGRSAAATEGALQRRRRRRRLGWRGGSRAGTGLGTEPGRSAAGRQRR